MCGVCEDGDRVSENATCHLGSNKKDGHDRNNLEFLHRFLVGDHVLRVVVLVHCFELVIPALKVNLARFEIIVWRVHLLV